MEAREAAAKETQLRMAQDEATKSKARVRAYNEALQVRLGLGFGGARRGGRLGQGQAAPPGAKPGSARAKALPGNQ